MPKGGKYRAKGHESYRSKGTGTYAKGRKISSKGVNVKYADGGANKVSGRKKEA